MARRSCSFLNVLLYWLNAFFFILAAISLAPVILLRMPPTSLGVAFLLISCISIMASLVTFYSQITRLCLSPHFSLILASVAGQLLAVFFLLVKEKSCLSMFKSRRDPREAMVLVRLESVVLTAMCILQLAVLALSCGIHSCCVRKYEDMEADKESSEKRKNGKLARVQEEPAAGKSADDGGKEVGRE